MTKHVPSDPSRSTSPISEQYTQFIYLQDVRYGSIVSLRFATYFLSSFHFGVLHSIRFRLGSPRFGSIWFGPVVGANMFLFLVTMNGGHDLGLVELTLGLELGWSWNECLGSPWVAL